VWREELNCLPANRAEKQLNPDILIRRREFDDQPDFLEGQLTGLVTPVADALSHDTVVGCWPVTAIRAADTVGNDQTAADPNWLPQAGNTAVDPWYPGAHATISAGGALVLSAFFGNKPFQLSVTS
jgi:hypothetical protein